MTSDNRFTLQAVKVSLAALVIFVLASAAARTGGLTWGKDVAAVALCVALLVLYCAYELSLHRRKAGGSSGARSSSGVSSTK